MQKYFDQRKNRICVVQKILTEWNVLTLKTSNLILSNISYLLPLRNAHSAYDVLLAYIEGVQENKEKRIMDSYFIMYVYVWVYVWVFFFLSV